MNKAYLTVNHDPNNDAAVAFVDFSAPPEGFKLDYVRELAKKKFDLKDEDFVPLRNGQVDAPQHPQKSGDGSGYFFIVHVVSSEAKKIDLNNPDLRWVHVGLPGGALPPRTKGPSGPKN